MALGNTVYIGHKSYTIAPQRWANVENDSVVYYNYVQNANGVNMWNGSTPYSIYLDNFRVGLTFFNPNPSRIPPPTFNHVEQVRDICNDSVTAHVCFDGPIYSGIQAVFQWRVDGQDWSEGRKLTQRVYADRGYCFGISNLPPRNRKVYWRAMYEPLEAELEPSDWATGSFETVWFPAPNQSVPDITEAECNLIARGELIDEITSPEQVYGWTKGEDL